MKKIAYGIFLAVFTLMAADGKALVGKCMACHGANFEKRALGQSGVVNRQSAYQIASNLKAYRDNGLSKYNLGSLMKGQVSNMSDSDIWSIANYIASLNSSQENSNSPFACEESELNFMYDDRYFRLGSSADGSYPFIGFDTQSVQIDRKNKTIKVWTLWVASEQEQRNIAQRYKGYINFGYQRGLNQINYQTMKASTLKLTDYNCHSSVIYTNDFQANWSDVVPGSIMEVMIKTLIEKYKLN